MELKTMTQKSLKEGIKKGMTAEEFCEKYECSQEELEKRIELLYKKSRKGAKTCFDDLLANEKKARKVKEEPAEEEPAEEPVNVSAPEPEYKVKESVDLKEEKRRLEKSERKLSSAVMKLESDHKELASEHRKYLGLLRDKSTEIDQIKADFLKRRAEYESLAKQSNVIVEQMNAISEKRRDKVVALEEIRWKLDEMSKVTLCVFNNGEITMLDGSVPQLSDAGHEGFYDNLCNNDLCDELKQREVKALARLLAIAENTTLTVEVICDSEELETAFKLLRK